MKPVPLQAESPLIYQTLSADHNVSHEYTERGVLKVTVRGEKWDKACTRLCSKRTKHASSSLLFSFTLEWKHFCFSPEFGGCGDLLKSWMYTVFRRVSWLDWEVKQHFSSNAFCSVVANALLMFEKTVIFCEYTLYKNTETSHLLQSSEL